MNTIIIENTLPNVFRQRTDVVSDVWNQVVRLERGHVYLIEATSGTGKSSLCSYLIGYRHDYQGRFLFDNRDIRTYSTAEWVQLRQHSLSLLFQELRLFPELTAMENVLIKNQLTGFKSRAEIDTWFDMLGIADKKDVRIGRMSFGQQQRVAMMRALVQPFDFILADEPISHLDDENGRIMGQLMMDEARRQGAGVVVTSIGKHMALNYEKTLHL